jgi:DNA-binding SARP family transcriptional activator
LAQNLSRRTFDPSLFIMKGAGFASKGHEMRALARVRLKLLGEPELSLDGAVVETLPKKAFIIAARLILAGWEHCATRDEMASFLWPDAPDEQRRASLRTVVKRIRVALAEVDGRPFRIDAETIGFDPEAATCDLIELAEHVGRGSLPDIVEASRLFAGALLEGLDAGPDSYRDWLTSERKRLGQSFSRAATRALKGGALLGQPRLRETIELKILAAAPVHAPTHSAMLKLQSQRGSPKPLRRPAPLVIAGWPLGSADRRTPNANGEPEPA